MDFYERKKRATNFIMQLYQNGTPKKIIYHKLALEYGFGEKFCDNTIERLEDLKNG